MTNFGIKPGMSCWKEMPAKYKEEYAIHIAKMEKKKFEKDRIKKKKVKTLYDKNQLIINKKWNNLIKKEKELKKALERKIFAGFSTSASDTEREWFTWMEY